MHENWKDCPSAPAEGVVICEASSVPPGGVFSVDINGFPVLLARSGEHLVAYVNACPHQFLPLDYRSSSVLSADGRTLRCTNHQAGFDLMTGEGIEGLGRDCVLDPVPIHEDGEGRVVVGAR